LTVVAVVTAVAAAAAAIVVDTSAVSTNPASVVYVAVVPV